MILELVPADHPVLRITARVVASYDDQLAQLADNLIDTMRVNRGIAIAAPQVGIAVRVIVVDQLVMVNPVIVAKSDQLQQHDEGCLSLPGRLQSVARPQHIVVEYNTLSAEPHKELFSGLFAAAIAHEIDHLDGILMTDYVS